jgi:putative transposase
LLRGHGGKATYLVLPLSFGKRQLDYLQAALDNPQMLRTAKLISRDGEYYLAVSVETAQREPVQTQTYLGVARALANPLTVTVADRQGKLLEAAVLGDGGRHPGVQEDAWLHRMANAIVTLAVRHRAQVVVQHLTRIGDRLGWLGKSGGGEPLLGCRAYNRLAAILDYKLADMGLPAPVRVSSLSIFSACPVCAHTSQSSHFSRNLFICTQCGYSSAVDALGGYNLAVRLLKYQRSPLKIAVTREKDMVRFTNELLGFALTRRAEECRVVDIKRVVLDELRASLNPSDAAASRTQISIARTLDAGNAYDMIELV